MKKFQKLYQLKQLVKAASEYHKYGRLTAKLEHSPEYDVLLRQSQAKCIELNEHKIYMDNRIIHIAYALLKGKSYQRIETSVRKENQLQEYHWKKIIDIMEKYKDDENSVIIPESPFPVTYITEPKKMEVSNE